ncbi:hypothetical protein F5Y09DRAFT_308845 [Xylaria sp. FL1042]|nr:hypothetical protein F5Y09DRAFT_308845 [Xylaria sp. FL1042]
MEAIELGSILTQSFYTLSTIPTFSLSLTSHILGPSSNHQDACLVPYRNVWILTPTMYALGMAVTLPNSMYKTGRARKVEMCQKRITIRIYQPAARSCQLDEDIMKATITSRIRARH